MNRSPAVFAFIGMVGLNFKGGVPWRDVLMPTIPELR